MAYLQAENAYAEAVMKPTEGLQKKLYDEMLSHIKQTDVNVPYRQGDYFYYSRTEEGKQYPIFARKKGSVEAAEEIVLDVNKLAEGQKFMSVGAYQPSEDGNLLAYSTDNIGYRQYVLHVKDLRTGQELPDRAEKTGSINWAADNKTIFYTVENPAKRQWRLYRHALGDPAANDALVYEEKDDLYDLYANRSAAAIGFSSPRRARRNRKCGPSPRTIPLPLRGSSFRARPITSTSSTSAATASTF